MKTRKSTWSIRQISLILIVIFLLVDIKCYVQSINTEDSALEKARTLLRKKQRFYTNKELQSSNSQLVTDAALKYLENLTRFIPTEDPNMVRRGPFRYDRTIEEERIARAQALIRRVEPGPFEDPNYFAILANQAASIELGYEKMNRQSAEYNHFSKFLLGTVHAPDLDAFAQKDTKSGYTIVLIYSGLIDFIYQAAKVTVEALNPLQTENGQSAVNAMYDLDVIRARLDSNPKPADRLYQTLEAYFFYGYPRAAAFETVPEEHYPMLSITVGMAERWIIGHEYGHGFDTIVKQVPDSINAFMAKEYFADNMATISTVYSAAKLDGIPPEFSLGGAIFALASLDVLQKAYNIILTGQEKSYNTEEITNFKPKERAENVINIFRQFFDVNYYPDRSFDLEFHNLTEPPKDHNFTSEHSKHAYAFANVLLTVWEPVMERLLEDYRNKRPMHELWDKTDVK